MKTVKAAIAGTGSCASSFVQGCWYYHENRAAKGLIRPMIGSYGPGSVQVVAAFDVNADKVGLDLADAMRLPVNVMDVADGFPGKLGVTVQAGPLLDGVGTSYSALVPRTLEGAAVDVVDELRRSGADVLVSYMPVGSEQATLQYAQIALDAGCAFVNAVPVYVARRKEVALAFEQHNLPLIGDDVKGQTGATILHRTLVQLFSDRGMWLDRTTQDNWGGMSGDFINMRDEDRLETKRESKTVAVTSLANRGAGLPSDCVKIGPSGTVEGLGDVKKADIVLEGTGFMGNPVHIEVAYSGGDSPQSAACVYDCVRWARLAMDAGIGGRLDAVSGAYMKAPADVADGITDPQYSARLAGAEIAWSTGAITRGLVDNGILASVPE